MSSSSDEPMDFCAFCGHAVPKAARTESGAIGHAEEYHEPGCKWAWKRVNAAIEGDDAA